MTDPAVAAFATYLSTITDETERKRAISAVKMLAVQDAPKEAFDAPIKTLRDYLATPIEIPPVLIEPYMIVRGGLHATIGRAGKGKTVLNLNRCLRWSAGLPWFKGWEDAEGVPYMAPEKPLRILIVENEGAAGLFHRQIGLMLHAKDYMPEDAQELAKENILIWGDGGYSDLKLDDTAKRDKLRAGIEQHEPDLVFVEPFRSLWAGEENSSTEMSKVVDALMNIATDYKCAALIAHHMKKGGGEGDEYDRMSDARGSSVLEGAVTMMENFDSVKGGDQRELLWSKNRHGRAPNPVRMEWDGDSWWYKWVPITVLDDSILHAIRTNNDEAMSIGDLHDVLNEPKNKLRDRCRRLTDEGRLKTMPSVSSGAGSTGIRYRVPSDESSAEFGGLAI